MNVGSLFSGIGGFELGLERAGMRVVWQSEIDPYASAVLRKHWPEVPNHGDIRSISATGLRARDIEAYGPLGYPVGDDGRTGRPRRSDSAGAGQSEPERTFSFPDVICGGFPCQDISNAGKRAGIDGERSRLWGEYARVIGELRPRYVLVENVAALLGRGFERVLGDLAALGFDAEWHCIPAAAVGAPHRRDRVWIMAHARDDGRQQQGCGDLGGVARSARGQWSEQAISVGGRGEDVADADGRRQQERGEQDGRSLGPEQQAPRRDDAGRRGADVADAEVPRLERWLRESLRECAEQRIAWESGACEHPEDYAAYRAGIGWSEPARRWWVEPAVGRVAAGIPRRVDRLRCLGMAVVSQIPEILGKAIIEWDSANTRARA